MLHMSLRNIESSIPDEMRKPYLQKPPEQEQEQRSIPTGVIFLDLRLNHTERRFLILSRRVKAE